MRLDLRSFAADPDNTSWNSSLCFGISLNGLKMKTTTILIKRYQVPEIVWSLAISMKASCAAVLFRAVHVPWR